MADNIAKLRLYQDTWNAEGMTDENSLANALLTQADVLSPVLTHLAGREDRRFPLTFLTEGMGNLHYINDIEYDYPVIGRLKKAVIATSLTGNGYGYSKFKMNLREKCVRQYLIQNSDGLQVRIMEDPVEGAAGGWDHICQLVDPSATAIITDADVVGRKWSQMYAPVALSGSRGNESQWGAPSKMRNQGTQIRKSYRYEGNIPNKVVNVEFVVDGKRTKLWYDFEEWQHMLSWKEEGEYMLWYSKYNRDANGVIHLKDENGKPIPLGSGIFEQIPNRDTYGRLTAAKLKSVVRDALYGTSDAQNLNITLYTGTGGMEEFDTAMKDEVAAGAYIKNTDPQSFISGSSSALSLGGFFTQYRHQDGHIINVVKLPLLDNGAAALASDPHPITGLPMESYKMIFLDQSTYDGQSNIQFVTQKGRELIRWAVAGATIPPGFTGNALRANDIDGASVHFMKLGGVSIRRATNCMYLECALS